MRRRRFVAAACSLPLILAVAPPAPAAVDVALSELRELTDLGRIGVYPNGSVALAPALSVCNVGDTAVPWNAPMDETHPFMGFALYRSSDGALEMIGRSWIKHAVSVGGGVACGPNPGCFPGSLLQVGCSDTYAVPHNGSRYYLGPRREVNPYAGTWQACGSFFDEPVIPDADCDRDYFGDEPDPVAHRLRASDSDLLTAHAVYYLEGECVVASDAAPENNIGYRVVKPTWTSAGWTFPTQTPGPAPALGLLVEAWSAVQEGSRVPVGPDDGEVVLGVRVTQTHFSTWHYEYALYNWRSARMVRSLSIPIGGATLGAVSFRDPDSDPANDWAVTVTGGVVTWSTSPWSEDPDANALEFQSLYNFRFDADVPADTALARGEPFLPGVNGDFAVMTLAPLAPAAPRSSVALACSPSPFSSSTTVSFELSRGGRARVSVVDVTGRRLGDVFRASTAAAGAHDVTWTGRTDRGDLAAPGIYFIHLETDSGDATCKVTRIR